MRIIIVSNNNWRENRPEATTAANGKYVVTFLKAGVERRILEKHSLQKLIV